MTETKIKICEQCHSPILLPKTSRKHFCEKCRKERIRKSKGKSDKKCRKERNKRILDNFKTQNYTGFCEFCNCEHDGKFGSGRFCSKECLRKFNQAKSKEFKHCEVCGRKFKSQHNEDKCHVCLNDTQISKFRIVARKGKCKNCHKIFTYYTPRPERNKFCSRECYHSYRF